MKNNIRIRVAVVILKEDKILLVQHHKNGRYYWLLPGGGLEFGETIEECACRELQEETGLNIQLGDFLFLNESIPPDEHRHVLNLYYMGSIKSGTLQLGNDEVLSDARFIPLTDFDGLPFYPNVKKELLEVLHNTGVPYNHSLGNRWE